MANAIQAVIDGHKIARITLWLYLLLTRVLYTIKHPVCFLILICSHYFAVMSVRTDKTDAFVYTAFGVKYV